MDFILQHFFLFKFLLQINQRIKNMKKEDQTTFQNQIKFLHKKFNVLDRPNTKILYQFCQFDPQRTYKVLAIAKTMRNPGLIIQILIKNPEKSQQYLDELIGRYDKEIGQPVDLFVQKDQIAKVNKDIKKLDFQFFKNVPQDTISVIMNFLDPYSLKLFSFTSSSMNKIANSQCLSQMYKSICKVLFSMDQPLLPFICRFQSVKKYVLTHPDRYFPYHNNFKNAVNNNLRNYIWRVQPKDYKLDKNYYLNFGSYQNLFEKCPRVNMNGFYVCKQKYVKIGQKDARHVITPIHVIFYFRYLRFLEDGSVIYHVSNRKLKNEQIIKNLGKACLQKEGCLVGQYMQYKNELNLKAVQQNQIFSFKMQINSTQNKICNELKVISYELTLVDKSDMHQQLFTANPNKQDLIFNYVFHPQIQQQNGPRIQACSL